MGLDLLIYRERMETVFDHWNDLCENIQVSETIRDDWWTILSRRYGEEWRFYHTLQHLKHLLDLFCQWKELIIDLDVMRLAIFFHDVVYDPMAKDNELQSIVLFNKFSLDTKLPSETVNRVSEMIKATINHSVPDDCKDLDLCLFLDFDLGILGAESQAYKVYSSNIRKEYIHLDDTQFSQGRAKVLQSLLKSKQLYATEELRDIYEAQARDNMRKELESILSQTKVKE